MQSPSDEQHPLLIAPGTRAHDARVEIETIEQTVLPETGAHPAVGSQLTVSPAELRAIGSLPTSTHIVWLPSRCAAAAARW